MDCPLAKIKGPELKVFIKNIPHMAVFLQWRLGTCEEGCRIAKGLVLWNEIVPFLAIAHVKDKALYPSKISKFESDVKKLSVSIFQCSRVKLLKTTEQDLVFLLCRALNIEIKKAKGASTGTPTRKEIFYCK